MPTRSRASRRNVIAGRRCGSSNVGGERLLAAPIAEAPPFSNRLVDAPDECVRVFAKRVTYSAVQECIRASPSERDLNENALNGLCAALLTVHVLIRNMMTVCLFECIAVFCTVVCLQSIVPSMSPSTQLRKESPPLKPHLNPQPRVFSPIVFLR